LPLGGSPGIVGTPGLTGVRIVGVVASGVIGIGSKVGLPLGEGIVDAGSGVGTVGAAGIGSTGVVTIRGGSGMVEVGVGTIGSGIGLTGSGSVGGVVG